jgi:hypothetical protein
MVKYISEELMIYLDSVALAYWSMDDGGHNYGTFVLSTQGFTYPDACRLVGMLHYNFGLYASVKVAKGLPVIHIDTRSRSDFYNIVQPHFHPDMEYKLTFRR